MTSEEQILAELEATGPFSGKHAEAWRNTIASDLNTLLGRAEFEMGTRPDEADIEFAAAVLRLVKRIAETENIKEQKHEQ